MSLIRLSRLSVLIFLFVVTAFAKEQETENPEDLADTPEKLDKVPDQSLEVKEALKDKGPKNPDSGEIIIDGPLGGSGSLPFDSPANKKDKKEKPTSKDRQEAYKECQAMFPNLDIPYQVYEKQKCIRLGGKDEYMFDKAKEDAAHGKTQKRGRK